MLGILAHVCPRLPEIINFKDKFISNNIYKLLKSMGMDFKFVVLNCEWLQRSNTRMKCLNDLATVLTDDGICFAFNALNPSDTYTNE